MRSTHTFAELKVSREAYLEIYTLLAEAGYHHAFIDGAIDMHGIALTMGKSRETEVGVPRMPVSGFNVSCQLCRDGIGHNYHTAPPTPEAARSVEE